MHIKAILFVIVGFSNFVYSDAVQSDTSTVFITVADNLKEAVFDARVKGAECAMQSSVMIYFNGASSSNDVLINYTTFDVQSCCSEQERFCQSLHDSLMHVYKKLGNNRSNICFDIQNDTQVMQSYPLIPLGVFYEFIHKYPQAFDNIFLVFPHDKSLSLQPIMSLLYNTGACIRIHRFCEGLLAPYVQVELDKFTY